VEIHGNCSRVWLTAPKETTYHFRRGNSYRKPTKLTVGALVNSEQRDWLRWKKKKNRSIANIYNLDTDTSSKTAALTTSGWYRLKCLYQQHPYVYRFYWCVYNTLVSVPMCCGSESYRVWHHRQSTRYQQAGSSNLLTKTEDLTDAADKTALTDCYGSQIRTESKAFTPAANSCRRYLQNAPSTTGIR
jgi:hypothetical protein